MSYMNLDAVLCRNKLRIPIRGYEAFALNVVDICTFVTNPYKGL